MLKNGSILVVDDEEIMREILETLLKGEGYSVRLAASGAPGRRPTLRETVESYIGKRTLAPGVDRDALIQLGTFYLQEADAAANVASAGTPATLGG